LLIHANYNLETFPLFPSLAFSATVKRNKRKTNGYGKPIGCGPGGRIC